MIENLIHATEHLAGFFIVILALSILWGMTALIGRLFGARAAMPAPAPVVLSESDGAAPDGNNWLREDEIAAVCAAAATMLDERHRIVSVRSRPSGWGQQGRRDIHASHRIR